MGYKKESNQPDQAWWLGLRKCRSRFPRSEHGAYGGPRIDGEQRWYAIGAVSAALLLVVHIYGEDDVNGEEIIRIISAREAKQRERRIYIQQAGE